MGALTEKIRSDMTEAMKSQEKERLSTIRMLQSALKNEQINTGHELSDEEAMSIIRKAVKQRQDSIEQYTNAGRTELAEKERSEMELLRTAGTMPLRTFRSRVPAMIRTSGRTDSLSRCG